MSNSFPTDPCIILSCCVMHTLLLLSEPVNVVFKTSRSSCQKSDTLPFLSQSPYLVGSGPFGPPFSLVWGLTPPGHSGRGSFSASGCLFSRSVGSSGRCSSSVVELEPAVLLFEFHLWNSCPGGDTAGEYE